MPIVEGISGLHGGEEVNFICHSMGSLVARWYVEQEGGAAHTRKLMLVSRQSAPLPCPT